MEKNKLMFHEEVDKKVAWFNVFNIIFLLFALVGGAYIANSTATIPTTLEWQSSFNNTIFITTLAIYTVPAILLFMLFKLLINIYGEKVRGNYYKQMMLEKMDSE